MSILHSGNKKLKHNYKKVYSKKQIHIQLITYK